MSPRPACVCESHRDSSASASQCQDKRKLFVCGVESGEFSYLQGRPTRSSNLESDRLRDGGFEKIAPLLFWSYSTPFSSNSHGIRERYKMKIDHRMTCNRTPPPAVTGVLRGGGDRWWRWW